MPSDVRGPQFVFRISKNKDLMTALQTALIFAVYMMISVGLMCYLERDWTNIDGAYFAIATVSTVGYGDIAPTSDGSRWVTIFMIVFGITLVFSAVAGVIAHGLAPITKYGRALMEKALPRQGVDLDGDGGFDFYIPRAAPIYYAKNLLPTIVLFLRSKWPLRAFSLQSILRIHLANGCITALSRRRLSDTATFRTTHNMAGCGAASTFSSALRCSVKSYRTSVS